MSLQDSPSLDDYKDGLPASSSDSKQKSTLAVVIIGILVSLVVILSLVKFFQSDTAATLLGKGTVTGNAVNEFGNPITVDVFVLGSSVEGKSDVNGYFSLSGVPSGEQSIIVAYGVVGTEVVVDVVAGEETSLGEVVVEIGIWGEQEPSSD